MFCAGSSAFRLMAMFDNLRRAFREAVDNFNRELERDAMPEAMDGLLKGMEREAVSARAGLEALKEELSLARKRAAVEQREAEVCRRREELARGIGDSETADIAASFGEKHEARCHVLTEKRKAIEAELRLRESEFSEMLDQIKQARANRSSLEATAGRTRARQSVQGSDDLFGELDRMAEKIEGTEGAGQREEAPFDDGQEFDEELGRSRREEAINARLEELKRRMGRR